MGVKSLADLFFHRLRHPTQLRTQRSKRAAELWIAQVFFAQVEANNFAQGFRSREILGQGFDLRRDLGNRVRNRLLQ